MKPILKSVVILLAYALAAQMQAMLRHVDAYRGLYRAFPFYVPETFKVLLAVAVCVVVTRALYGKGDHFLMKRRITAGLLFGVVATLPMLVMLAATRSVQVRDPIAVSFLAAWFP